MTGSAEITYRAFLSYSHKDTDIAVWLHRKLENWRIDRDLVARETDIGPVPQTLRPVFRDRDDFAGGHSLADATLRALESSLFLIVLCSPNAAGSTYVNEEVRLFKAMGRSERVIPVIIAGEPGGRDDECFPPAVKFTVAVSGEITRTLAEPVAPDMRDIGDGRIRAVAKIVAGLLGVRYDEIIQRTRKAEQKRRLQVALAAASFTVMASMGGYFYWQSQHLSAQQELSRQEITKLQSLVQNLLSTSANASEVTSPEVAKALENTLKSATQQANAGDRRMAQALQLLNQGKTAEAEKLFRAVADEKASRITQAETLIEQERADTAAAFRNLASIAGLGDPKRARDAYTEALHYEPDHPDALYWHGWLNLRAGDLVIAEQSLTRLMELSKASQDNRGLFRAHLRLGEIVMHRGDLEAALAHQRAAFELARDRAAQQPMDTERRRELAQSYASLGDVHQAQGKLAAAFASFRENLSILKQLAAANPKNPLWQTDLSEAFWSIGGVQVAQGDLAAALRSYQDSLAISQRLAATAADNAYWQRGLAVSHRNVGDVQRAQGDYTAALASYQNSLAIAQRLAASDPGNAGWQEDLSVFHNMVGDVQRSGGKFAAALKSFGDGLAIRMRLAASDPRNARWQNKLSLSHSRIGDLHRDRGDLAAASKSYNDSLAIMERLAAANPDNPVWQHGLGASYVLVGNLRLAQDDHAAALASYRDSLAIITRLAAADPGNAVWQRDLSTSHATIGDAHKAGGDLDTALSFYRESLAIIKRLALSDTGNAGWQHDLAMAFHSVGSAQWVTGDLAAARASYRSSLVIMERLATSNTGNIDWQVTLATSYLGLAKVLVTINRRTEALALLKRGRTTVLSFAAKASDPRLRNSLAMLDQAIAGLRE